MARLCETAIQGATRGATKCNIRCYILKTGRKRRFSSRKVQADQWGGLLALTH